MKFSKFKMIALLVLLMAAVVGCSEDDEPQRQMYSGWGFIYSIGTDYYVTVDGGLILKVKDMSADAIDMFEENDRIILNYYIEESIENPVLYDYVIELVEFGVLKYTYLQTVDDESRDTLGAGYVELGTNSHLSGDILNLQIYYVPQSGEHVFTLCYDETLQEEGRAPIFDLRNYFPEEESGNSTVYTFQSFNIHDILGYGETNEDGNMEFILRINHGDSQEQELLFEYLMQ